MNGQLNKITHENQLEKERTLERKTMAIVCSSKTGQQ